jgi:peroxiredoxin
MNGMSRTTDLHTLPADLPSPHDEGATTHLQGMAFPALALPATDGSTVTIAALRGRTVLYAYPRTGQPDQAPPDGWDLIPGARGCTPQSCAFRDHYQELQAHGARVFGVSTQNRAYQQEAAERLHLPFPLLSDAAFQLTYALRLPLFEVKGTTLLKRITLIIRDGMIEKVFYPVFPPDQNAATVLAWLEENPLGG